MLVVQASRSPSEAQVKDVTSDLANTLLAKFHDWSPVGIAPASSTAERFRPKGSDDLVGVWQAHGDMADGTASVRGLRGRERPVLNVWSWLMMALSLMLCLASV